MIGHRGAATQAAENTIAGLEAGVAAGADLVEFDVGEGLLVGHPGVEPSGRPPTLDDALAYLAGTETGAHIDLKIEGVESLVAAAVRRHGLEERTIVSSNSALPLRRFAGLAPGLVRAFGYPQDRHGISRFSWPGPIVEASVVSIRPVLRLRLPFLLRRSQAEALSLHHALVSTALVDDMHRRGLPVLAWTVNQPEGVVRLARMGVDGIVSDDPGMARRVLATLNSS